jgi:hypothetical protein
MTCKCESYRNLNYILVKTVASVNMKLDVLVCECVLFFLLSERIACVPVKLRELRMFVFTFHSRYYKYDTVFMFQLMCILCFITWCLYVGVLYISGSVTISITHSKSPTVQVSFQHLLWSIICDLRGPLYRYSKLNARRSTEGVCSCVACSYHPPISSICTLSYLWVLLAMIFGFKYIGELEIMWKVFFYFLALTVLFFVHKETCSQVKMRMIMW